MKYKPISLIKIAAEYFDNQIMQKTEWSRSINCVYSRVLPRLSTSLRMPYILIPKNQVLTNWKHFFIPNISLYFFS